MKDFPNIGKRLPYAEEPEYVRQLISRTTEEAISRSQQQTARTVHLRPALRYAAAAAVAALLVVAGITLWPAPQQSVAQADTESPLDQFLSTLSDEEAQLLAYYDIEDLPEYE